MFSSNRIEQAQQRLNRILTVEALDNREDFKNLIQNCAISQFQVAALEYFKVYFKRSNACRNHPLLGDLLSFANEIEQRYSRGLGQNIVVLLIQSHFRMDVDDSDTDIDDEESEYGSNLSFNV